MELRIWKALLLKWVEECSFIENISSLEVSNLEAFYAIYAQYADVQLPVQENFPSNITVPLSPLQIFLKELYPDFKPHLENDGRVIPADYIYVYTLLLHYKCVQNPSEYFHNICKKLPITMQQCIADFFKQTVNGPELTRYRLQQIICNVPVNIENNLPVPVAFVVPDTMPSVTSAPPTPKTELLEQRTRELLGLRAQLETERYEKTVLEEQILENEHLINSLSQENNLKKKQLTILKATFNHENNGDDNFLYNYVPNEFENLKRRMLKELSDKDSVLADKNEQMLELKGEHIKVVSKLKVSEKQLLVCMDRISELELRVDNMIESLSEKDVFIASLKQDKKELQQCLQETRDELHNGREVLNASSDLLNTSLSSSNNNITPENLGNSVIDKQLREKEQENQRLREQLDSTTQENKRIERELLQFVEKYKLEKPIPSNGALSQMLYIIGLGLEQLTINYEQEQQRVRELDTQYKILTTHNVQREEHNQQLKNEAYRLDQELAQCKCDLLAKNQKLQEYDKQFQETLAIIRHEQKQKDHKLQQITGELTQLHSINHSLQIRIENEMECSLSLNKKVKEQHSLLVVNKQQQAKQREQLNNAEQQLQCFLDRINVHLHKNIIPTCQKSENTLEQMEKTLLYQLESLHSQLEESKSKILVSDQEWELRIERDKREHDTLCEKLRAELSCKSQELDINIKRIENLEEKLRLKENSIHDLLTNLSKNKDQQIVHDVVASEMIDSIHTYKPYTNQSQVKTADNKSKHFDELCSQIKRFISDCKELKYSSNSLHSKYLTAEGSIIQLRDLFQSERDERIKQTNKTKKLKQQCDQLIHKSQSKNNVHDLYIQKVSSIPVQNEHNESIQSIQLKQQLDDVREELSNQKMERVKVDEQLLVCKKEIQLKQDLKPITESSKQKKDFRKQDMERSQEVQKLRAVKEQKFLEGPNIYLGEQKKKWSHLEQDLKVSKEKQTQIELQVCASAEKINQKEKFEMKQQLETACEIYNPNFVQKKLEQELKAANLKQMVLERDLKTTIGKKNEQQKDKIHRDRQLNFAIQELNEHKTEQAIITANEKQVHLEKELTACKDKINIQEEEKLHLNQELETVREKLSKDLANQNELLDIVAKREEELAKLFNLKQQLTLDDVERSAMHERMIKLEKARENTEKKMRELQQQVDLTEQEKVCLSLEVGGLNLEVLQYQKRTADLSAQLQLANETLAEMRNQIIVQEDIHKRQQSKLVVHSNMEQQLTVVQVQLSEVLQELNSTRLLHKAVQCELDDKIKELELHLEKSADREGKNQEKLNTLKKELDECTSKLETMHKGTFGTEQLHEAQNQITQLKMEAHQLELDCQILQAKYRDSKEEINRSEQKLKDQRLEMEGKLEKMKIKMRTLYAAEVTRMKEKQERDAANDKVELEKLTVQNVKYEEHTRKLSNQIVRLNERILEQQKQYAILCTKLRHLQEASQAAEASAASNDWEPFKRPIAPSGNLGSNLAMEDEEGEVFNNTYLTDLKLGRIPDVTTEELQYRNSLQPPHLKSTYAAQYDLGVQEDDFKDGSHNLDDSMSALLSTTGGNSACTRKKSVGTHYKRPGPPTPCKNGGRLSFGTSEPEREILRETCDNIKTPARFKIFASRFSIGGNGVGGTQFPRDENSSPKRRLSNMFKRK